MSAWFVSGGSRGLGRSIVLTAAQAGHDVAFTWVSREDGALEVLDEAARLAPESRVRAYELDVSDSAAVENVGDQVLDEFETVNVVVPNAGITRDGMALSMSDEDWTRVLSVNLTGAFYVARQFLPTLLANRHGRIVFVSSIARKGIAGQANYSASKAGLVGLAMALGKEYGSRGITSNVVVPGFFDTDMTGLDASDAVKERWLRFCPAGRIGAPGELASAVLYLASDEAGFINAQTIGVTGGLDWIP